jgi:hypothetical protein
MQHLNHPPFHFNYIILAAISIIPYVVTVCVFLSVNKTDILDLNVIAYNITMVNGLFKFRKLSKIHNNDRIVLICKFKIEQTGLHRYIYMPTEIVIGQVVLKILSKRLAVDMVNKTVVDYIMKQIAGCGYDE